MIVSTAKISSFGRITIPKLIRDSNGLGEGAKLSMVDLGDGCLLVEPMVGDAVKQINRSFDRTSKLLGRNGAIIESALAEIRLLRESGDRVRTFERTMEWAGETRNVEVLALGEQPLIGTDLIREMLLQVEVTEAGDVSVEPL